ncbi:MAG: class F sortase [Caldilineaceae bacterium]
MIDGSTPDDAVFSAWNNRAAVTREEAYPVRIKIPVLGVDSAVEPLGERADGSMATPTDPAHVAWYSYGAIPGENGNVVMAGHLDRIDGSPAVFWNLHELQAGDEVIVYDSEQTAYHYAVLEQQSYPYDKAPVDEITGFDLVSRLNVTCRGTWDRNRRTC